MTLTLNAVIQFFAQEALAYDSLSSDQVWLPKNQQFRGYSSQSHILIIWTLAVTLTLKTSNIFSTWQSGSWCITIPSLATKCSAVDKISGQTFTDILNLHCDLGLERNNPFLFHRTLRLRMLYYQTKFGCKRTAILEDTVEIVIFWLNKPLLWPWHWRRWTNFSAWHCGSWRCVATPELVSKSSKVQKISSGQTFTDILNLRCDLDLERSNPVFPKDTPAYDAVPSNQVW